MEAGGGGGARMTGFSVGFGLRERPLTPDLKYQIKVWFFNRFDQKTKKLDPFGSDLVGFAGRIGFFGIPLTPSCCILTF